MTISPDWWEFGQVARDFGIPLTDFQLEQFARYETLLLFWNEQMNLTAVRDPGAIRLRHFLDSLSCSRVMGELNGRSLIDVGTGAGFPGLPLKILFPRLKLTLVESIRKKGQFLQAIIQELGLDNVVVLTERAETLGQSPEHRQKYDWAVARAVAELRILLEYLLPLCRIGGKIMAQKGVGADRELQEAAAAIRILGGSNTELTEVWLPQKKEPHFLIVVAKVGETPAKYPRRAGVPGKRPL